MERRLGRDPFASSGMDRIFNPIVEQATIPASKPKTIKAKPRHKTSAEVSKPHISNNTTAATSARGLPKGWTRATFIVREDLVHKVKRAAYWDRKQIKDVVTEALDAYLADKNTD